MFEIGGLYAYSNIEVRDTIVVTVCISLSPVRLLRLNHVTESKVSDIVPDLTASTLICEGGPNLKDKFFYLHKFSSLTNTQRITKDLYLGGNVAEVILLDKHEKLHVANIAFYTGCYELTNPKEEIKAFRKIGDIQKEDVFLATDYIETYWSKRYANFLVDASKLVNTEYITHEQLNEIEKPRHFFKSKLWLKPWLVLSILMNAVSLINVGIDLKLMAPKWLSFFQFFIDFARTFSYYLTYPFQFVFSFWGIQIPEIVSSTVLFVGIVFGSLRQASNESDKYFKKNSFSKSSKKYKRKHLYYALELVGNYSLGLLAGVVYAGLMWIFLGLNPQVVASIFITAIFIIMIEILFRKTTNLEDKYRLGVFKFYIVAVWFLLLLFSFINYCGLELFNN